MEFTISEKPLDPAHAFGLTFSPLSKPPAYIIGKARPFTIPQPSFQPQISPEPDSTVQANGAPSQEPPSPPPHTQDPPSQQPVVPSPSPSPSPSAQPPPPKTALKSWASLFPKPPTPSSSSPPSPRSQLKALAGSSNGLPSVHVPTLSYSAASTPVRPFSSQQKIDPYVLLTRPPHPALIQPTPLIHPRGLVNAGNLCFANSILQALVHCPPLWRIMVDGIGPVFESTGVLSTNFTNGSGRHSTALLEAMLLFFKEFKLASEVDIPNDPKPGEALKGAFAANSKKTASSGTPGTPLTVEQLRRRSFLQDPFLPEFLWDALRENKRFDSMTTGQQEDAEEFLGFFLDTLHEELLFVLERLGSSPKPALSSPPKAKPVAHGRKGKGPTSEGNSANSEGGPQEEVETREVTRPLSPSSYESGYGFGSPNGDDEAWLEVGKKNKVSVTRTTQSSESAITQVFGGKLRSVLKIPGAAKDSATLEPYQALQLDITPDHVESIEDAIKHLTQSETVSIHSTSKGYDVSAFKQVFIETLPPILILHLKRFIYEIDGGVQKSQKEVRYGSQLEIPKDVLSPSKRDGGPVRYQLIGAVYHHGKFTSGGHYTIDILRQDHSEWLRMDDTLIEPVPEDDVVIRPGSNNPARSINPRTGVPDKVAYLLFYQRLT